MDAGKRFDPSGRWARFGAILLISTAGGILFTLIGLPAPWISGPLVAATIAVLAGLDTEVPRPVMLITWLVLGVSMGGGITPETIARLPSWPASLIILTLTVGAVMAAVSLFLRGAMGWDKSTSLYASAPGALSQVMLMAMESSADSRKVAVSQTLRVFVLVALLPGIVALLGAGPMALPAPPAMPLARLLGEVAAMMAVGSLTGWAAQKLKMPGGLMLGAMIGSSVLHATGLIRAQVPLPILIPAMILLGMMVGLRFRGTTIAELRRMALASLGAFGIALAVSLAGAVLVRMVTGLPLPQILLAFAPGGLEALVMLSLMLDLDPAYVVAHHLFRWMLLATTLPLLARRMGID